MSIRGYFRPESPPYRGPFSHLLEKPGQPESAEELRQIAERLPIRKCQREASRPFYQFLYQVEKERERIQQEMSPPRDRTDDHPLSGVSAVLYGPIHHWDALDVGARGRQTQDEPDGKRATIPSPHDINTMAYERVRESWTRDCLWNAN